MRRLEPTHRHDDRFIAVLPASFGAIFSAMGVFFLFTDFPTNMGALLFVAFGGLIFWGGIDHLWHSTKFGEAEGRITEGQLYPGDSLQFRFRQPVRRPAKVQSIGLFLVFRETVDYYDGSETQRVFFDRLIQKSMRPRRTLQGGDTILEECSFQLPRRSMGIKNHLMGEKKATVETQWIIKVRLELGNSRYLWHEYKLYPKARPTLSTDTDAPALGDAMFDVYTQGGRFRSFKRWSEVMDDVAPHLDWGQGYHYSSSNPILLLERLPEREALAIKVRLEKVDVSVDLRPSV